MGRGVLGARSRRAMTDENGIQLRILAALRVRVLRLLAPLLEQRAQGKPGADRTHGSRVVKNAGGRTTGVTGNNPAFPARWVTAYFVLSPARLGFFVTAFATRIAQCDETPATGASGPHDFTVRLSHASSVVISASTASHRNTPDDAQRPSIG